MSQLIQNPYAALFAQQAPKPPATKAVIYARCSPTDRETETSLFKQVDDCRRLAQAKYLDVLGNPYVDDQASGKNTNRPKLQQAIAAAREHKAAIITYDISRLSRSLYDTIDIITRLDKEGIPIMVASGPPVDMSNPYGRMVVQITAMMAEFYREVQAKSTKEGLDYRRKQGKVTGKTPFGWKKDKNGMAVPDDHQQRLLRWMCWRYKSGFGIGWITRELELRGYYHKMGYKFRDTTIDHLVKKWQYTMGDNPVELDWYDAYVNYKLREGTIWPHKNWFTRPPIILHRNQVPTRTGKWPHKESLDVVPAMSSSGVLMLPLEVIRQQQYKCHKHHHYHSGRSEKWGKKVEKMLCLPAREEDVDPVLREGFYWEPSEKAVRKHDLDGKSINAIRVMDGHLGR